MSPPDQSTEAGDSPLLLVYGSLLKALQHPMHRVLAERATFLSTATFGGRLYDLGDYPGAIASPESAERVHGEIYRLLEPAAVLAALDEYEGFFPASASQSLFVREEHAFETESGDAGLAWVYLYNRPVRGRRRIESGCWLTALGDVP